MIEVLKAHWRGFGPYEPAISEIYSEDAQMLLIQLTKIVQPNQMSPFSRVREDQVHPKDNAFICKIMQLDWRKRPTAKELLADEWFRA